jgi:hypothetical protein
MENVIQLIYNFNNKICIYWETNGLNKVNGTDNNNNNINEMNKLKNDIQNDFNNLMKKLFIDNGFSILDKLNYNILINKWCPQGHFLYYFMQWFITPYDNIIRIPLYECNVLINDDTLLWHYFDLFTKNKNKSFCSNLNLYGYNNNKQLYEIQMNYINKLYDNNVIYNECNIINLCNFLCIQRNLD